MAQRHSRMLYVLICGYGPLDVGGEIYGTWLRELGCGVHEARASRLLARTVYR